MKHYHIVLFLYLLLVTGSSCSQDETVLIVPKEPTTKLIGQKVIIGDDDLLVAHSIMLTDSSCMLVSSNDNSGYLNIFDVNTFQRTHTFGQRGQGPYDFSLPFPVKTFSGRNNHYALYDINLGKYVAVSIEENRMIQQESRLMPKLVYSFNLHQLNDTTFVGTRAAGVYLGLYFIYHTQSDSFRWIPFHNENYERKEDVRQVNDLYYSALTVNAAQEKVAVALRYFNQLLLLNLTGEILRTIQIGDKSISPAWDGQSQQVGSTPYCFTDIYATNNYIYALWRDNTIEGDEWIFGDAIVYVLDWDGRFVRSYLLDKDVDKIVVSKNDTFMLGITDDGTGLTDVVKYVL